MTWAKAENELPYGLIRSSRRTTDKGSLLDVVIPGNTTAAVYLPAENVESVMEAESLPVGPKESSSFAWKVSVRFSMSSQKVVILP